MLCPTNAAATMRLLASSPIARISSVRLAATPRRARPTPRTCSVSVVEVLRELRASASPARHPATRPDATSNVPRRAGRGSSCRRTIGIALPGQTAGFDQPIGHLRHRRHDDDRRACRLGNRAMLSAHDGDHARHRVGVGDRRAAELHDDVHSSPSRCISSALRIAAPAAPRIVLWPSATNL